MNINSATQKLNVARNKLRAVLCDPEDIVVIYGSQADRDIAQQALELLKEVSEILSEQA